MWPSVVPISPPGSPPPFPVSFLTLLLLLIVPMFPAVRERVMPVDKAVRRHTCAHTNTSGETWESRSHCHFPTFPRVAGFRLSPGSIRLSPLTMVTTSFEARAPEAGLPLVWKENLKPGGEKRWFVLGVLKGFWETKRILLLCPSGGFEMNSKRKSAKLKLRRSLSEQLRSSTSKAWDLLWKGVRERRLAGQ